ncbi:hypothetical protein [Mycoplana dimorpha]|uniref:Uncharacterized protein n=1 Tax=Mycoplana dimorpha TaxID=28320 RepID=A0A2T5B7V3_MYCDI|nr:hypothetical protein [Mycoplana dimorpha]PTM95071.1 hypothetical protein C7449_104134 [Mycoplana dimorpha]
MPLEAPSSLPQRSMVCDEATVTIPHAEYLDLREDRLCLEAWKACGVLNEDNSLGLFAHDAEVAIFIAVRRGLMTAREVVADIERRFGEERKPPVGEIKRFWLRFQKCLIQNSNEAPKKPLQPD